MLFLARFTLKGLSQAALVAAAMAIIGLLVPPAAWISAAAIVLVTLVQGPQRGLVAMLLSMVGVFVFGYLIFAAPEAPGVSVLQMVVVYVLLAWLPAWFVASVLRQTISLAYSLQILTAMSLLAVILIYVMFPGFGEFWREPLDNMVSQLAQQSDDFSLAELQRTEDWVIEFIPGLFASSLMFGTMMSLFLGRWWQAVFYNPGGFAKEFQSLNLGKIAALIAFAIIIVATVMNNVFAFALLTVVFVLYLMQGLSLMHALINIRQLNTAWLFVVYLIMFFIPHLVLLLVVAGLVDPWVDIRQRFRRAD